MLKLTYVYSLGGRLSGEHGIGAKKVEAMEKYTEPVEMKMMKEIKRALDPKNILNPGKWYSTPEKLINHLYLKYRWFLRI